MNIQTLDFNDFTIDYCKFGKGDKIFVILPGISIKSVMLSASAIEKDYSSLADDFTTYVIERRNNPDKNTTINSMADDTIKVLDKLQLRDIYLFGASQGGMLAIQIAINRPELIKKMVLGSTSAKIENNMILDRWVDLAKKKDREALFLDFGKCIYPGDFFTKNQRAFRIISKSVSDKELERFICIADATRDYNILGEVKNIKCPTLAIGAKDDAVLGGYATEDIAKAMGCDLYMYDEGFGHAVFDMAPDYKQRIIEFFNK